MSWRGRGGRYPFWKKTGKKSTKGKKNSSKKYSISFQLYSVDSFQSTNTKDANIINIFKAVKGFKFVSQDDVWTFPLSQYTSLEKLLEKKSIGFKPIPVEVLKNIANIKKSNNEMTSKPLDFSLLPCELSNHLLPFQWKGLEYALKHNGTCLIGDEEKLFKQFLSRPVIGIASFARLCMVNLRAREEWPLLIIVPSSLRYQWEGEIIKWLPEYRHKISVVGSGKEHVNKQINIIPYSLVDALKDEIKKKEFGMVICDECHYLKSSTAQRTKTILPIIKKIKRRILLSGTPALSRPAELYCQLVALGNPIFKSFHDFGFRYCAAFEGPQGWDYTGSCNLQELNAILKASVMVRRLKKDVLTEMVPKIRHFVRIEPDKAFEEKLKERVKTMNDKGQRMASLSNADQISKLSGQKNTQLTQYYTESGLAKVESSIAFLKKILAENTDQEKILVFAHHLEVLDQLSDMLAANKVRFLRVDGATNPKEKELRMSSFNTNPTIKVFLLSLTCAGVGFNLTAASMVIFVELFWTPASLIQAEDRVHRIGQKRTVTIYYLLCNRTIDDVIWPMISRKLAVIGKSVDGQVAKLTTNTNDERYKLTVGDAQEPVKVSAQPEKKQKERLLVIEAEPISDLDDDDHEFLRQFADSNNSKKKSKEKEKEKTKTTKKSQEKLDASPSLSMNNSNSAKKSKVAVEPKASLPATKPKTLLTDYFSKKGPMSSSAQMVQLTPRSKQPVFGPDQKNSSIEIEEDPIVDSDLEDEFSNVSDMKKSSKKVATEFPDDSDEMSCDIAPLARSKDANKPKESKKKKGKEKETEKAKKKKDGKKNKKRALEISDGDEADKRKRKRSKEASDEESEAGRKKKRRKKEDSSKAEAARKKSGKDKEKSAKKQSGKKSDKPKKRKEGEKSKKSVPKEKEKLKKSDSTDAVKAKKKAQPTVVISLSASSSSSSEVDDDSISSEDSEDQDFRHEISVGSSHSSDSSSSSDGDEVVITSTTPNAEKTLRRSSRKKAKTHRLEDDFHALYGHSDSENEFSLDGFFDRDENNNSLDSMEVNSQRSDADGKARPFSSQDFLWSSDSEIDYSQRLTFDDDNDFIEEEESLSTSKPSQGSLIVSQSPNDTEESSDSSRANGKRERSEEIVVEIRKPKKKKSKAMDLTHEKSSVVLSCIEDTEESEEGVDEALKQKNSESNLAALAKERNSRLIIYLQSQSQNETDRRGAEERADVDQRVEIERDDASQQLKENHDPKPATETPNLFAPSLQTPNATESKLNSNNSNSLLKSSSFSGATKSAANNTNSSSSASDRLVSPSSKFLAKFKERKASMDSSQSVTMKSEDRNAVVIPSLFSNNQSNSSLPASLRAEFGFEDTFDLGVEVAPILTGPQDEQISMNKLEKTNSCADLFDETFDL